MKSRIALLTLVALAGCILGDAASLAAPMGTAFTYQGRFNASGSPANGAYDFEFKLFDAATLGSEVGSTVFKNDLSVSDGYFTTTLDFDAGRFTGDARWLQIAVRPGAETGAYTTLTPRHELTPTPYAINSDNEGTADYLPKFTSTGLVNSVLYESGGKVGVGTTVPSEKLAVAGNLHLAADDPYLYWNSNSLNLKSKSNAIPVVVVRGSTSYNSRLDMYSAGDTERRIMLNTNGVSYINGGNVGIGTTAPVQKLDVSGTVQCVSVVQTSDEQLKTDIQPLARVLERIEQVRAVSFRWNEKARSLGAKVDEQQIGVLAQELEQAFPELVITPQPVTVEQLAQGMSEEMLTTEMRQRLQADADATHYKAVNYSQLTVVLLEAVKELKTENNTLRQRIEALEAKAQ